MKHSGLYLSLALTVLILCLAAWLVLFFNSASKVDHSMVLTAESGLAGGTAEEAKPLEVSFNPPALEDAPEDIREAVLLGYKILTETKKYAGEYVGNDLACTNCHFDGGRSKDSISLVGVAATYPRYRSRSDWAVDLTLRTYGCFERSMNGRVPPADGQIMQSLMAYYFWISKGIPIYADVPWLRLPHDLGIDYEGNSEQGKQVFDDVCARCHGEDGHGTDIAPALWGPGSFNDGAGMNRIRTFSSFTYRFMPKSSPSLTKEQALDVAVYAHEQPRPKFTAVRPVKVPRVIDLEGPIQ